MRYSLLAIAALALTSCAAGVIPSGTAVAPNEKPAAAIPARSAVGQTGLQAIIGKDIGTLKRMFGEPRLDVVEVQGRKLQFVGKACVLDIYLYPEGKGGTEIVTYVDARRSDGAAVDRVSCVSALQRR